MFKKKVEQSPYDLGVASKGKKVFLYSNLFDQGNDSFRVSSSEDGLSFKQYSKKPVIINSSGKPESTLKCKDFRISKTDKGYFLTYKSWDNEKFKLLGALSKDLITWNKTGEISGIFETAMVVPDYKFKNQYVMYFGEGEIKIAFSKDLKTWEVQNEPVLRPRNDYFDNFPLEISALMETEKGILLIYYVKIIKREGDYYLAGASLFDKNDPEKVLWRRNTPIWEQGEEWIGKKIYPLGALNFNEKLIFYFGIKGDGVFAVCYPSFSDIYNQIAEKFSPALEKFNGNPIIKPILKHYWESQATFNTAAVYEDNKVHFVYRAIGGSGTSVLGYASSKDGIHIDERLDEPIYIPTEPFESPFDTSIPPSISYMSGGGYGGCEDPRITKIDDKFYMTYVAFNGTDHPRVALTSIKVDDFLNKNWNWEKPRLISAPGVVNKNACIFPERINGKHVVLHRIFPNILLDFVDDLNFEENQYLRGDFFIQPRNDFWDSRKIGAGAPPIKTKEGWLLIYHAVDNKDSSRYKIGAMLLDLNDPAKVLYRSNNPILEPTESYENDGYKAGVAYPCGAVVVGDQLLVYYGGADTVVCAASEKVDKFMDELKISGNVSLKPLVSPQRISKYND
ncbi:MAG: hypothetical protein Q7K55_06650 [Candidatus Levybacteria bacterium]|nr:hypothetical protein [Candidatus Levybacteria bacterium]